MPLPLLLSKHLICWPFDSSPIFGLSDRRVESVQTELSIAIYFRERGLFWKKLGGCILYCQIPSLVP